MPAVFDVNAPFLIENGHGGIHILCKHGSGKDKIQTDQQFVIFCDQLHIFCRSLAEGGQYLLNLPLLPDLQLFVFVVQTDDSHGLDEEGGAGGTLVMDHARHLIAVFRLHRQAVPAVPHGDDCILQPGAGGAVDHGVQSAVDPVVHLPHGAPDLPECAAGIVCHGVFRQNTASDLMGECGDRLQKAEKFVQRVPGTLVFLPRAVLPDFPCGFQKRHDLQKLAHAQHTADLQPFYRSPDIPDPAEGQTSSAEDAPERVCGLCLCPADLWEGIRRQEMFTELFGACGCGVAGQYMNNLVKFQFF